MIDISESGQNTGTDNYRSKISRGLVEKSSDDLNLELVEVSVPSASPISRIITILDNYNSAKVVDEDQREDLRKLK